MQAYSGIALFLALPFFYLRESAADFSGRYPLLNFLDVIL
jgi:hypothetical protein